MKTWGLFRGKIVLATFALTMVAAIPALANEPMTQSIEGGDRAVNVTAASLPVISYSHNEQSSSGTVTLSVDDSTGSDAGWNVTLQASDFVDGDKAISASNLSIIKANAPVRIAGQEIDAAGGPTVPNTGAIGSLDAPRKVLHAQAGYGKGTYEQKLDVQLTIPGQTLAGNYGTNLTVNITAGP